MSRKLFKSTAVVALFTFISRISGMVRDIAISHYFGAKGEMDAFLLSFKIPNFFRRLFAEASFAYAFVPVLTEYKTKRSHEEVQELVDRVAGALASVLFLITLLGVIFAPIVVLAFAPKWAADPAFRFQYDLASTMLMLTFPYLLFIALTAFAGGILNAYNKFAVPAFTPVLLNIALIASAVYLTPFFEPQNRVVALAWGVFIAGIIQLLFQLPYLMQIGLMPRPKWGFRHSGVKRIMKLMVPTLISSSVMQISLLIDLWLATSLHKGSLSWLYYSDRLVEFPLGVFGIAIATVILPSLSRSYSEESHERFSHTMDWALRWMLLIGVPSMVGLLVFAGPLITTVYYHGAFSPNSVVMTTWALMAYSAGLMGFIFTKVLSPGFYARQDTRTPMIAAIISLVIKVVLSVAILYVFKVNNWLGAHTGLAFATGFAAILNAWILYRVLRKRDIYQPNKGWLKDVFIIVLSSALMAALILWMAPTLWVWMNEMTVLQRAGNLLMYVGLGVVAFFVLAFMLGLRPWRWKSGF